VPETAPGKVRKSRRKISSEHADRIVPGASVAATQ